MTNNNYNYHEYSYTLTGSVSNHSDGVLTVTHIPTQRKMTRVVDMVLFGDNLVDALYDVITDLQRTIDFEISLY